MDQQCFPFSFFILTSLNSSSPLSLSLPRTIFRKADLQTDLTKPDLLIKENWSTLWRGALVTVVLISSRGWWSRCKGGDFVAGVVVSSRRCWFCRWGGGLDLRRGWQWWDLVDVCGFGFCRWELLWILWVRRTRADLVLLWLFLFIYLFLWRRNKRDTRGKWKGVGDGICFMGGVVVWCSEQWEDCFRVNEKRKDEGIKNYYY